jgi:DNA-binding response OmpR family regulator
MQSKPPVILFAERDLSRSREARAELRRRGAEVRMASSLEAALREAQASPSDLVILDEDLEGPEGRDAAQVLGAVMPEAEMILLESDAPGILRGAGPRLFFSGTKPIAPEMLIALAQAALGDRLPGGAQAGASPGPGTVLCVDDDPRYLRSVSRFLSRHGYLVSTFDTAERALGAIPRLRPDLALVDIMMPGMGGLDLGGRIRDLTGGRTAVVFLTGLDSEETYYEAHQRGGAYLLGKSERPQKVLDVVDYLAGHLDEAERRLLKEQL